MPTRWRFLAGAAAIWAAGVAWGCSTRPGQRSGAAGSGTQSQAQAQDLAHFMALSGLLTGFGGLDAVAGGAYLGALRADAARSKALDALVAKSGIASDTAPSTLAELARTGVFADPGSLATTAQILAAWFSGTYNGAAGTVTATWSGALAWRSCGFTKAPASCGGAMGYWAKAPA